MSPPAPVRVPVFIVIGGGADGVYYVRQLRRAIESGRLVTERIVVVDRDPVCPAAGQAGGIVAFEEATWGDWLDRHLAALDPAAHLVPYHWAPHLLVDWLAAEATRAGARVRRGGSLPSLGLPMERDTAGGESGPLLRHLAVSADLHRAGVLPAHPRSQGLEPAARAAGDRAIVFRCLHLIYGVGTIPVAGALAARHRLLSEAANGRRQYLVATSSHCHALATALEVGPA